MSRFLDCQRVWPEAFWRDGARNKGSREHTGLDKRDGTTLENTAHSLRYFRSRRVSFTNNTYISRIDDSVPACD